jgi:hypothetical protein
MTLLSVGVNDIGRKSCSTDFGGFVFGIGTTSACFQIAGTTPSCMEELKMQQSG